MDQQKLPLPAGITGVCLVALATLPALRAISDRYCLRRQSDGNSYQALHELYHDKDGPATEESTKAFSDRIQRFLIGLFSLVGLLVSLATAVLVMATPEIHISSIAQWLVFSIWVSLSLRPIRYFILD